MSSLIKQDGGFVGVAANGGGGESSHGGVA